MSVTRPFSASLLPLVAIFALTGHDMGAQSDLNRPSVQLTQFHDYTSEVRAADFNEDGIMDLVGEEWYGLPGDPSLLLRTGRGDGTFGAPVNIGNYTGPPAAVGDLNADGFIDIVTTGDPHTFPGQTTAPYILPGRGNATFAAHARITGQVGATAEVADLNNDGHADLVTLHSDQIFVYPGHGDFTFGPRTALPAGFMAEDMITGDFNGDGLLDIASTSKGVPPHVRVFINQGNLAFVVSLIPLLESGGGITASDMNDDTRLDLVVGTGEYRSVSDLWLSGRVLVFFGYGDGTFATPLEFATNTGPTRMVTGDVNADGIPDVVSGNRSTRHACDQVGYLWASVSILLGRGDGTLEPAQTFSLGETEHDSLYKGLRRLDAADLNGDGRTDLISSPGAVLLMGPPVPNQAPVADAGPDTINPLDGRWGFRGSATDPDFDWLSFEWRDDLGRVVSDLPTGCVSPYSGTHTFTLTVQDGRGGVSTDSVQWTFPNGGTMPSYLQGTNIGDTGVPGGEMARPSSNVTFEAVGGGADIWGTSDAFRFVHMTVSGNFDISAEVLSLDHIHPWTKGGLMIRQTLAPDSRHASVFATPTTTNGVAFQRREFDGGATVHTSGPATAPVEWLRLVREGDMIGAYSRKTASDSWTFIGNQTLPGLTNTVYVGVAVTSHVYGIAATGLFGSFVVSPLAGGPVPSPDGTEVPPAAEVIDATGSVWTLGPQGDTLRNGSHAGGGYGFSLLWTGGTLYTLGLDDQWWQWTDGWTVHGPTRPGSGHPGSSPDGTELPPAAQVIDTAGAAWTLGPAGETLRNGIHVGGGYGLSLLWTGGTLYAYASDDQWWRWTGAAWVVHGPIRPGT